MSMQADAWQARRSGEPLAQARAALADRGLFDTAVAFWRGTSGHDYVHTVYTLVGCPELPPASAILVHRDEFGVRTVLRILRLDHECPTLNRADVRHAGATLGANEVHVHFLANSKHERHTAAFDLETRIAGIQIVGATN